MVRWCCSGVGLLCLLGRRSHCMLHHYPLTPHTLLYRNNICCLPPKDMVRMHVVCVLPFSCMGNAKSMRVHSKQDAAASNAAPACVWGGHCALCSVAPRAAGSFRHWALPDACCCLGPCDVDTLTLHWPSHTPLHYRHAQASG